MKFSLVFVRWFHRQGQLQTGGSKSAKGVLKLVKQSSEQIGSKSDNLPTWKKQVLALRRKFNGERWNPAKKLSRIEMEGMRVLKSQFPQLTATELAERYKVSPEVVRRILKSKWQPTEEEMGRLHERWKRRGERIKELYQNSPELKQDRIEPAKMISIGSGRTSSDLVVRRTKKLNDSRKLQSKNGKGNSQKKGKLFLLQQNSHND